MSGEPSLNYPLFNSWATTLRDEGFEVFNPAEGVNPEAETEIGGSNRREIMRRDLVWILDEADEIAMIDGWQRSKGAKAEKATAESIGLPVRYLAKRKAKTKR